MQRSQPAQSGSRLQRGAVLLEVLVASVLMATVLLISIQAIGRSGHAHRRAERVIEMGSLAQMKMDEVLKQPLLPPGMSESGDFDDLQPEYVWDVLIEPSPYPELVQISVRITERSLDGTFLGDAQTYTLTALRRPGAGILLEEDPLDPPDGGGDGIGTP